MINGKNIKTWKKKEFSAETQKLNKDKSMKKCFQDVPHPLQVIMIFRNNKRLFPQENERKHAKIIRFVLL